jgi:hypothetical protein
MDGLMEWWRSMPRSKQVISAFVAFWLVYACAAVYDWTMPGPADATARMAAASGFAVDSPGDVPAIVTQAVPVQGGGLTMGDVVVLVTLGLIIASLSTIAIFAWRELRGANREPGMAAGDDPLWSGAELDMAFLTPDRI